MSMPPWLTRLFCQLLKLKFILLYQPGANLVLGDVLPWSFNRNQEELDVDLGQVHVHINGLSKLVPVSDDLWKKIV